MTDTNSSSGTGPQTQFEKFREFTRKVVSVPKTVIDRREKEYKEARKRKRRQRA